MYIAIIIVSVHIAPPEIYVHPVNKTIEIDNSSTSVTLVCMANNSFSYYWQKENGDIQENAVGNLTNALLLVNITPSDSGHYRCVAQNNNGKTYSDYGELIIRGLNIKFVYELASTITVSQ